MRDYGKLYTGFWTSPDMQSMGDDAKLLAIYLLTGPHTNLIGCFRVPDGYIAADLRWSSQRVSKGFAELFQKGFATRDEHLEWVLIFKFLKWNKIENPNQAKFAVKLFHQVPTTTPLKALLAAAFEQYAERIDRSIFEQFLNPSETVSEPFRNQEQEQEQNNILYSGKLNPFETLPKPLVELSELYHREYHLRFPTLLKTVTPKLIAAGAATLQSLMKDGYDLEKEIKPALRFALNDREFWSLQVRSLASLRKKSSRNGETKFSNLLASSMRNGSKPKTKIHPIDEIL